MITAEKGPIDESLLRVCLDEHFKSNQQLSVSEFEVYENAGQVVYHLRRLRGSERCELETVLRLMMQAS
jgi:hypothetical protein